MKTAPERVVNLNIEHFLCLNKSQMQQLLYITSLIHILLGSFLTLANTLLNLVAILFFFRSRRAKNSPLCIYLAFLAGANLLRTLEFTLILLAKTSRIPLSQTNSFCQWISFLPAFSGHIAAYIVVLVQLQRLLTIRNSTGFNLVLYNHALAVITCLALISVLLIADQFFLYDTYFLRHVFRIFTP